MNVLLLRDTGFMHPNGLRDFELIRLTSGKPSGRLHVLSGQPGRQNKRLAAEGRSGSLEPIPEGRYEVGPPEWRGRRGDYSASWGSGLGPVWCPISPLQPMNRGDFGFHLDENHRTAPGSAGCIVFWPLADFEVFLGWQSGPDAATDLIVDHGLGTVSVPQVGEVLPKMARWKLFQHSGKARGYHNGGEVPFGEVQAWLKNGAASAKLNGSLVDLHSLAVDLSYARRNAA